LSSRLGDARLLDHPRVVQHAAAGPLRVAVAQKAGRDKGDVCVTWRRWQVGADYGACEQRVRDLFAEGRRHGRAVIFIDEVDVVASARAQVVKEGGRDWHGGDKVRIRIRRRIRRRQGADVGLYRLFPPGCMWMCACVRLSADIAVVVIDVTTCLGRRRVSKAS
jgi:hypothetical protein